MNRKTKRLLTIVVICVTLLLSLLAVELFAYKRVRNVSLKPLKKFEKNYANYYYNDKNVIDYSYDKVAYLHQYLFGTKLVVIDVNNNVNVYNNIGSPFQITDDYIVHCSDGVLRFQNMFDNKSDIIEECVSNFIAIENKVFYMLLDEETYEGRLWCYNILEETNECVINEDIYSFYAYGDEIYALVQAERNCDFVITRIDSESYESTELIVVSTRSFPFFVTQNKDNVVYTSKGSVYFLNMTNGTVEEVVISDDVSSWQSLVVVSGENGVYVSYQKLENVQDLFTVEVDDISNGVYFIDSETLEAKKLCNISPNILKIYGNVLIGEDNNIIYKINAATGESSVINN